MVGLRFILTCLTILTFTCPIVTSSEGKDVHSVDYETVMKIVEKLEKRVAALEVENVQQRLEISELRGLLQTKQEYEDTARVEVNEGQSVTRDIVKKYRIQRAYPEMTVAFYASLQSTVSHLGNGQNVFFENVVTNLGNGYDSHAGIFRAPIAGVYVFSTTVVTNYRDTSHYGIALNGKPITVLFVHGAESAYDGDSQTVVLQLQLGDDVSVQHTESDKGLYGSNHCVFSGFLLSQQEGASIVG